MPLENFPPPSNILDVSLSFPDDLLTHVDATPTENAGMFALGNVIRCFLKARSNSSTEMSKAPA